MATGDTSRSSAGSFRSRPPERRDLGAFGPLLADDWAGLAGGGRVARLEGSVLVVDVSGYTRFSEHLAAEGRSGGERVTRVVDDLYSRLLEPVVRLGGDVLSFAGDALLVVLRGPLHADRAAHVALSMQAALRGLPAIRTPRGLVRLRASIGVSSGQLFVARLGVAQHVFLAMGEVVSEACALEKAAGAGEVFVGSPTASLLSAYSVTEARGGYRRVVGRVPPIPRGEGIEVRVSSAARSLAVPEPLRTWLLDDQVDGEHRPVAVGFVSLSGLDREVERAGVESVAERLERIALVLEAAQVSLGVTWLSCDPHPDGCSFFLCSGVPALHDDDEDRLLQCLHQLASTDFGLQVAVGMNRGRAFTAPVGPEHRRTFSVTGETVNVAARVAAHADDGTVLVTDAVLRNLRSAWSVIGRPAFRAKGVGAPVVVHEVLGRQGAGRSRPSAPFIGRANELVRLRDALGHAGVGSGSAWEVVAEAGMGKSRLLEEFLAATPIARFVASGDPYSGSTPFAVVQHLIRAGAGVDPAYDPVQAGALLLEAVRAATPHLEAWTPLVAMVIGAEVESTVEVRALDPRHVASRRDEVVTEFLRSVLPSPCMIVVEDFHWLDEASTRVVGRLANESFDAGWLLIATRRPGGVSLRDLTPTVEVLELKPLGQGDAEAVVLEVAGDAPIGDRQIGELVARAGGNPLFLAELTGSFVRSGELPDRVERVIGSVIDELPVGDRRLLRDASVIGSRFDRQLVAEAVGDPRLGAEVPWARLSRFVEIDHEMRFRHDLYRAVAYEGLSYRRRRELHGRVGDALSIRSGEGGFDDPGVIALHFHRAGRHSSSWEWSVRAARAARARGAGEDAVTLYRQALVAAGAGVELDPADLADVGEEMGDLAELTGNPDVAHEGYRTARRTIALLGPTVRAARLLRKHGYIAEKAGDYQASLRWYRRALRELDLVPASDEVTAERVKVMLGYGITRINQGKYRQASAFIEPQLEVARALGDLGSVAHTYSLLERIAEETGDARRADHERAALSAYEDLGDQRGLGLLRLNVGLSAANEGRWRDAIEHYDRASMALEQVGHTVGVALVANNKAELLIDQGRLDEAGPLLVWALRAFRVSAYALGVAIVTSGASRLEVRAGRTARAEEMLLDAQHRFELLGARPYVLDTLARRAECLVAAHRPDEALTLLDEVERDADAGMALLRAFVRRMRACALAQLGRSDEALAVVRTVVDDAPESVVFEVAASARVGRMISLRSGAADPFPAIDVDAIASRLGVVAFPDLPIGSNDPTEFP